MAGSATVGSLPSLSTPVPTTIALRSVSSLSICRRPLDGRNVSVSADTKIGEVVVVVPPDAAVTIDSHVGAGQSTLFGRDRSGLNVTDHVVDTPAGANGTLQLDLDVAAGR